MGGHARLFEGVGALDFLAAEAGDLVRAADLLDLLVDLHEGHLVALLLAVDEVALARQHEDVALQALDHDRARAEAGDVVGADLAEEVDGARRVVRVLVGVEPVHVQRAVLLQRGHAILAARDGQRGGRLHLGRLVGLAHLEPVEAAALLHRLKEGHGRRLGLLGGLVLLQRLGGGGGRRRAALGLRHRRVVLRLLLCKLRVALGPIRGRLGAAGLLAQVVDRQSRRRALVVVVRRRRRAVRAAALVGAVAGHRGAVGVGASEAALPRRRGGDAHGVGLELVEQAVEQRVAGRVLSRLGLPRVGAGSGEARRRSSGGARESQGDRLLCTGVGRGGGGGGGVAAAPSRCCWGRSSHRGRDHRGTCWTRGPSPSSSASAEGC